MGYRATRFATDIDRQGARESADTFFAHQKRQRCYALESVR